MAYNTALLLMTDDHPIRLLEGYGGAERSLELIRLQSEVPGGTIGYVTQIASGSRSVRLDAMRCLERRGIAFEPSIPTE